MIKCSGTSDCNQPGVQPIWMIFLDQEDVSVLEMLIQTVQVTITVFGTFATVFHSEFTWIMKPMAVFISIFIKKKKKHYKSNRWSCQCCNRNNITNFSVWWNLYHLSDAISYHNLSALLKPCNFILNSSNVRWWRPLTSMHLFFSTTLLPYLLYPCQSQPITLILLLSHLAN